MKSTKAMFLAACAVGGLLACTPVHAQDSSTTNAPTAGLSTNAPPRMISRGPNVDGLARILNLTDDQKAKVGPIVTAEYQDRRTVALDSTLSPDDKRAKIKALYDDTAAKLKPILTDEQFQKWSQMGPHMRRLTPPPPLLPNTNAPAMPTTPATPPTQ
jgi:hypothetical protein